MGDGPVVEVVERIARARAELERAAELLRGPETAPSAKMMRAEQQVTRALGSLWGIDL